MGFGKKLKTLLDENKKTAVWLSKETGIPTTTIYSLIKRDNVPKIDTVKKISNALNIPIYMLLDEETENHLIALTAIKYMQNHISENEKAENITTFIEGFGQALNDTLGIKTEAELEAYKERNMLDAIRDACEDLNEYGKQKVMEQIEILLKIPEYRKDNSL